ncbi:MAG: T9SS type A sorting domain-containing protein [Saprospiraceae bacterium]
MRPFYLSLVFCLAALTVLPAQTQMFPHFNVPVSQNGQPLSAPFAGGLNAPQFSAADLNHDGVLDLVIFDRSGDVLLTYLNNGTANQTDYTYAPEYACNFPLLADFVVLRDFNQDGAADIFCASTEPGTQEIQVYEGYFDNNILKFKPHYFGYPADCDNCDPLLVYYPSTVPGFWNNFSISKTDYPSIDDIDGDGDLDIVAFPSGNSTHLTYLQNQSVEKGYGVDSLIYIRADDCWGGFYENGLTLCHSELASTPDCCAPCFAPGAVEDRTEERHPGATVLTYDQDGDGDKDAIIGNISFNCLNMLSNGGSASHAWMNAQDTLFPSYDVVVDIAVFPAAFYLDLDNDGRRDLMASPNNKTIGEDQRCTWFYRNTGTATVPHFELQTKKLFVDQMIDLGTTTHPAFADVNADGRPDLVVGNYGYFIQANSTSTNASLYLFLNTGTATEPKFSLSSNDWLGMSEFATDDYDFAPTFSDLDGDGDEDLVVGSNLGSIYYYENTAGAGNPMNLVRDQNTMWLFLDVGQASAPAVLDLDNDGLKDLIVGERQGNLNFFRNIGSPTQPIFAPTITESKLGNITTSPFPGGIGFSTPTIQNTNDGPLLLVGGNDGMLLAYQNLTPTANPYSLVSDNWGHLDVGNRSHAAFADLDDDGYMDLIVGNYRGGLELFKTVLADCVPTATTQAPTERPVIISPNPAHNWVQVTVPGSSPVKWRAFNAVGQLAATGSSQGGQFTIPTGNWLSGMYFLETVTDDRRNVAKLIVRH